jgi:AcrR family transcriptional regulator
MGHQPAGRDDQRTVVPRPLQPAAGRPGRLSAPERREHLLDVAAALVVEQGVDALTMEGVASRAGVSKGLGYAYFSNRDDLVVELFEREMTELDRRVAAAAAVARADSLEDRLRATVKAMFDTVAERGVLLGRLLQRPASNTPLAAMQSRRHERVETYFGNLIAGDFGLSDEVARSAATVLLAGANASIDLWVRRRMSRRDVVELVVRLTMGGLAALSAAQLGTTPASDGSRLRC